MSVTDNEPRALTSIAIGRITECIQRCRLIIIIIIIIIMQMCTALEVENGSAIGNGEQTKET